MTTDLPMCTTSLAPAARTSECEATAGLAGVVATAGAAGVGGVGGLTASSRFHMLNDLQASALQPHGHNAGVVGTQVPGNLDGSIGNRAKCCLVVLLLRVSGDAMID